MGGPGLRVWPRSTRVGYGPGAGLGAETGGVGCGECHLGNLGLGDTAQACKQLQVLAAGQQLEDGIQLRAVAHAAVSHGRFPGHAGDGEQRTSGTSWAPAMLGASRGLRARPPTLVRDRRCLRAKSTLQRCGGQGLKPHPIRACKGGGWGRTKAPEPLTCGLPAPPRPRWAPCPQSPCGTWTFSPLRSRPAAQNTVGTPRDGTHRGLDTCPSISDF